MAAGWSEANGAKSMGVDKSVGVRIFGVGGFVKCGPGLGFVGMGASASEVQFDLML